VGGQLPSLPPPFSSPDQDDTGALCLQCVAEITATEKSIVDLKKAIKSKENEVKVVQTRLYLRERRPNVEQCRDPVHYQLVATLTKYLL